MTNDPKKLKIILDRLKSLNVKLTNGFSSLDDFPALEIAANVFTAAKRKGFSIPDVLDKRMPNDPDGEFDAMWSIRHPNGILTIDTKSILHPNPSATFRFVDPSNEGLIWHELGHLYHWKQNESTYKSEFQFSPKVKAYMTNNVSLYATTNSAEFVAEVFSGINGKKHKIYNEFIMDLYDFVLSPKTQPEISQFLKENRLINLNENFVKKEVKKEKQVPNTCYGWITRKGVVKFDLKKGSYASHAALAKKVGFEDTNDALNRGAIRFDKDGEECAIEIGKQWASKSIDLIMKLGMIKTFLVDISEIYENGLYTSKDKPMLDFKHVRHDKVDFAELVKYLEK